LVREAMQALPPELPMAKTLHDWLHAEGVKPVERDQLLQLIAGLVEHAHGSQQDRSICRVPPHAGGRMMAPSDLDELAMSAVTGLVLALQRFVVLWGLGAEVSVVARSEGA
jgi:hypothetical protein